MSDKDQDQLRAILFTNKPDHVDENVWDNRLFDQYRIYVELMDKVVDRRHATNTLFLTTNSGLVTFFVAVIALLPDLGLPFEPLEIALLAFVIATCGIILSILWFFLIQNYRNLSSRKFAVIHELEEHLPTRLFAAEWIGIQEGKGLSRYTPLTYLEKFIPIMFISMYLFVLVMSLSLLNNQPDTLQDSSTSNSMLLEDTTTPETVIMPLPSDTP